MKQKMAQILILLQSFSVIKINNNQKKIGSGKQEKSKVALAAEKALDEAKNGSDPDNVTKLQRDV